MTKRPDPPIITGAAVLPPRLKTAKEKAATLAALTEEEKKKTRCCFTGHRPQKLQRPVDDIKVDLENEILHAIADGYTTFITGMAYGTDIWAGNIVVRLKDRFPDLKLIAAVPFPGFADEWDEERPETLFLPVLHLREKPSFSLRGFFGVEKRDT